MKLLFTSCRLKLNRRYCFPKLLYFLYTQQLPIIHCVEEREVVLSPYQTPQDISQKKGLVIKVHELYKWKHLPFAKVLFYDCERFGNSLLGHPNAPESVRIASTFFSVALFHGVHRIATDMKASVSVCCLRRKRKKDLRIQVIK